MNRGLMFTPSRPDGARTQLRSGEQELTKTEFEEILKNNKGAVVIKFGAEWCNPCRKIEPYIEQWRKQVPENVLVLTEDIDVSFELYATFKSKRQAGGGIPVTMLFKRGNVSYIPDMVVTGADVNALNLLFQEAIKSE